MIDSIKRCPCSTYCFHQPAKWQLGNHSLAGWSAGNPSNGGNITKSYLSKSSYKDLLRNPAHLGFAVNVPKSYYLIGRKKNKVKLCLFLVFVPITRIRKANPPNGGLADESIPTGEVYDWSR
jgi:hypothetical protein